jgi:hypothetical protein
MENKPDVVFPKAELIRIRWAGWFIANKVYYTRLANAGSLLFFGLSIVWRLPWHPKSAYSKGWDACWRELYENKQSPDLKMNKTQLLEMIIKYHEYTGIPFPTDSKPIFFLEEYSNY